MEEDVKDVDKDLLGREGGSKERGREGGKYRVREGEEGRRLYI